MGCYPSKTDTIKKFEGDNTANEMESTEPPQSTSPASQTQIKTVKEHPGGKDNWYSVHINVKKPPISTQSLT